MIKIFMGGGRGEWGGGSSERCLNWGGGIKGSFQKHLKTGGGQRQKLFVGEGREEGGFEGVTTPAPPKKI